jgi:hypothetical protein
MVRRIVTSAKVVLCPPSSSYIFQSMSIFLPSSSPFSCFLSRRFYTSTRASSKLTKERNKSAIPMSIVRGNTNTSARSYYSRLNYCNNASFSILDTTACRSSPRVSNSRDHDLAITSPSGRSRVDGSPSALGHSSICMQST